MKRYVQHLYVSASVNKKQLIASLSCLIKTSALLTNWARWRVGVGGGDVCFLCFCNVENKSDISADFSSPEPEAGGGGGLVRSHSVARRLMAASYAK